MEEECDCLTCRIYEYFDEKKDEGLSLQEIINSLCAILDAFDFDEREIALLCQAAALKVSIVNSKDSPEGCDPRKELAYILIVNALDKLQDEKAKSMSERVMAEAKPSGRVH